MRLILFVVFAWLGLSAQAASPEAPAQAGKQAPAQAEVPAPPESEEEAPGAPQVTITKEKELSVEEYRVNGQLYMIKITPKYGPPYYLVDDRGDGKFARQESLDSGFRVPRWVIKRF